MALRKSDLINMYEYLSIGATDAFKRQILKVTGRGGQSASRDYIRANALLAEVLKVHPDLSDLETEKQAYALLHPAIRFRLMHYTPCLAYRYDELKPEQQKELFRNKDAVFTEKENGVRGWLISYKGKGFLFSRNYSDKDCDILDYWSNVYQTIKPHDDVYAIDVEVKFEPGDTIKEQLLEYGIETDSKLEAMSALLQMHDYSAKDVQDKFKKDTGRDLITFRLIAPLYFNGKNYIKRTLGEGMDVYDECLAYGQSLGLNVKPIKRCKGTKEEKEIFLNSIIDNGGEGVVVHWRTGSYCTSENRSKSSYIKIKRSVSDQLKKSGLGDSIDGWISGYKLGSKGTANENLVSAFEISINMLCNDGVMREHMIASVPNIPLVVQKQATVIGPDGTPTLNPDFLGIVCEVNGQCISKQSRRLTHPRLIRMRPGEKLPQDCIYSEEFLNSQID